MKLQFRHQLFQAEAAAVVCDVFAGQLYHAPTYMIDPGAGQISIDKNQFTGFNNAPITVSDDTILENIRTIQRNGGIKPSDSLAGRFNLTIEMETGVGKTYTYIKTMYELNKRYGWSKFIIVVPSVAIREGVYKSLQVTEEHFSEDYGKKIRFFVYNSAQLTEIDRFASDSAINVMIINSQAFNARGKDARRIYMKLDEFRSRRPIDILAQTNPIMIIDEPQSVEGAATKERLKEFNPLITLRYSATHKSDSLYNMIYRLDALEAYNKRLVKKISVKGISVTGSTATEGYVYIQNINLSKGNPTATIEFDMKGKTGIRKVVRVAGENYSLYKESGELAQYKDGYTVLRIDGRDDYVIYDSKNEHDFAVQLEAHHQEVEVYVKLPKGFYINTPVGKYNPDWAIAFYEGKVKHIYFVAETKGDMSSMELRKIEEAKAHCAREHFRAISGDSVIYDVIDSYDALWNLVRH